MRELATTRKACTPTLDVRIIGKPSKSFRLSATDFVPQSKSFAERQKEGVALPKAGASRLLRADCMGVLPSCAVAPRYRTLTGSVCKFGCHTRIAAPFMFTFLERILQAQCNRRTE